MVTNTASSIGNDPLLIASSPNALRLRGDNTIIGWVQDENDEFQIYEIKYMREDVDIGEAIPTAPIFL
jgi:hypothetical protein